MCNLINERHIQILIAICEIHQFHFYSFHVVFHVWDVFRVLSGRTFVFGLHTKKVKNLFKTLKRKT